VAALAEQIQIAPLIYEEMAARKHKHHINKHDVNNHLRTITGEQTQTSHKQT
jgi:hypothetical protein